MKNIKIRLMNIAIKKLIAFVDSLSDDEVRSLHYDNYDVRGVVGNIKTRNDIF